MLRPVPHPSFTRSPRRRASALGAVGLGAAVLLGACGGGGGDDLATAGAPATGALATTAPPPMAAPAAEAGGPATTAPPAPAVELAEWQTLEITDVDGETFTVADLAGRPVFVEAFATWCSNCRRQLRDTQRAAATLGDDAVVLALSVETSLSPGDVADYAESNDLGDIRFAVMSPELLAAFVDAYGNTAANPPSVPHVIVAADGAAGDLTTGYIGADELVAELRAAS